jgi:hypothetical protein
MAAEIAALRRSVDRLTLSMRRPLVVVRLTLQEQHMLVYSVSAGPPVDADVVSRELTVVIAGVAGTPATFGGNATDLGEIKAGQGDEVTLSLVDVDDAGNRSQAAVVTFQATDTIPPATPGEFGVSLIREE